MGTNHSISSFNTQTKLLLDVKVYVLDFYFVYKIYLSTLTSINRVVFLRRVAAKLFPIAKSSNMPQSRTLAKLDKQIFNYCFKKRHQLSLACAC